MPIIRFLIQSYALHFCPAIYTQRQLRSQNQTVPEAPADAGAPDPQVKPEPPKIPTVSVSSSAVETPTDMSSTASVSNVDEEKEKQIQKQNINQRLMAEQQAFASHMQKLGSQLNMHQEQAMRNHAAASAIGQELNAMAQALNGRDPTGDELKRNNEMQTVLRRHADAVQEHQQHCKNIRNAQVAAHFEYENRQLRIAIETGKAAEHREMLKKKLGEFANSLDANNVSLRKLRRDINAAQQHLVQLSAQTSAPPSTYAAAGAPPKAVAAAALREQLRAMAHQQQVLSQQCGAIEEQVAHVTQLIAQLPAPPAEDRGPRKYNNLMSESEKQWLITIQKKQMHSENPYVDNFYYHTVLRKRAGQMQKQPPGNGILPRGTVTRGQKHEKAAYVPATFENALGALKGSSIRAPSKLIAVPSAQGAPDSNSDENCGERHTREQKDAIRRRQTLLFIERAYNMLLRAEDRSAKLGSNSLGQRARKEIQAECSETVAEIHDLLNLVALTKSWSKADDDVLSRVLGLPKGRGLVARLMGFFTPMQRHGVLLSLIRAAPALGNPTQAPTGSNLDFTEGLMSDLFPSVLGVVADAGILVAISALETAVAAYTTGEESDADSFLCPFAVSCIYAVARRADALLGSGQVPPDHQATWTGLVEKFATAVAPRVKAASDSRDVSYILELMSLFSAHSSADGKISLKKILGM